MLFRRYVPATPLDAFIEDFWLYQDYGGEHARERILPTGTVEMVFNLQEDELRIYGLADDDGCRRFSGAVISGPYVSAFVSDIEEEAAILGVHFKPGGASAVLGLPVNALNNTHVDLISLWDARLPWCANNCRHCGNRRRAFAFWNACSCNVLSIRRATIAPCAWAWTCCAARMGERGSPRSPRPWT